MNATATTTATGRDWRHDAECADVDPEIFYPLDLAPYGPAVTVAREICAGCPVRLDCLLDVMAGEDPARRWGITAGLTPDERADLFAGRRLSSARPGAVAA
ncbi:WhiB family transcriptional regulator [Pseudonocardia sp. KRD-184]|uniref:WhiB family transcriptional regulator n=1 Tax=Pseudonocardia oceani TaxID=2792013 RepID=A0ABS6U764_9PSEU|nr:WhiB family transcriptional regulator [Pseudonocardia oceani]MBW0090622.1 WhiB family transcriptional regulator [Pseudonocardia oceani]MBW0097742.1 WhiB family transcriptional regulator [Pseudonocardia oceani]MBW0110321.1 WhiB family transcriptional regulator [Pseudonocardia oceani]MBW0120851.1 WhiB family transcriptional regulator [Pseudonocardia oceani]MBW0128062.1 WhiB family transcriptional regulator [Pseudonocardia oceani]